MSAKRDAGEAGDEAAGDAVDAAGEAGEDAGGRGEVDVITAGAKGKSAKGTKGAKGTVIGIEELCKNINNTIIFFIFCIIIIIIMVALLILAINIINYILFTIYCINDNIVDYTTENPADIILGNKYKFRLLNYVNNLNYNKLDNPNDTYKSDNRYDALSSDLYIHKTITLYNYIVKLLLLIMFAILIGTVYNMFNILIAYFNDCINNVMCEFIPSTIYNSNTHIYYIIIIIVIFVCAHSYIYTYGFNKNIYKELYDVYDSKSGESSGQSKYKTADLMICNAVNNINGTDTVKNDKINISQFLDNLKNFSYDNIYFGEFLNENLNLADDADEEFGDLINNGIIANNKFIIPTEVGPEENTNILLKEICNINSAIAVDAATQELLANKIYLYLIYNYVIARNKEDPFIIHKLNNIFLNTFENLYTRYLEEEKEREKKDTAIVITPKATTEQEKITTDEVTADAQKGKTATSAATPAVTPVATSAATPAVTPVATPAATPAEIKIDRRNDLLDKFNSEIKFMYNEIRGSYTIKFLLPVNTKKEDLLRRLHRNADLILKYIYKYKENENTLNLVEVKTTEAQFGNLKKYAEKKAVPAVPAVPAAPAAVEKFDTLRKKLREKIDDFAGAFSNFYQEDKTLGDINRIVYKINFYLAIEMLTTIIFILLVLLILYKSNKYPFLEKYINIAITYAILIINEVISAILGIV
jgi:hypothetical protein